VCGGGPCPPPARHLPSLFKVILTPLPNTHTRTHVCTYTHTRADTTGNHEDGETVYTYTCSNRKTQKFTFTPNGVGTEVGGEETTRAVLGASSLTSSAHDSSAAARGIKAELTQEQERRRQAILGATGQRASKLTANKRSQIAKKAAGGRRSVNLDGSRRDPKAPDRQPRNKAVLPGSVLYTQQAKDDWDLAGAGDEL